MARGLSKQQKLILILAYRSKQTSINDGLLYYSEIFHLLFQWTKECGSRSRIQDNLIMYGSQNFDRSKIGISHYNSARVSISKAVSRLEIRGLVIRKKSGLNLTEAGLKLVNETMDVSRLRWNIKDIISQYV